MMFDKLLIDTNIFDVYSGKELDNNSKSLAISLYFRSDDKTLIDKDVDDRVSVIINILKQNLILFSDSLRSSYGKRSKIKYTDKNIV